MHIVCACACVCGVLCKYICTYYIYLYIPTPSLTVFSPGSPVTCVSLSHDDNCILVSTLDDTIRLLDRNAGELLSEYRGHSNRVGAVYMCIFTEIYRNI